MSDPTFFGIPVKREFNLSHIVSFLGTLMMVGVMWGTFQLRLSMVERNTKDIQLEQAKMNETVSRISENEAVLAAIVNERTIIKMK